MKLYSSPTSPFVRKVRIAAIELGLADRIDLEPTQVSPVDRNRRYAEAVNPLRKIPALLTDEGAIIHGSLVICDYLDALAGGGLIIPREGAKRWQVLTEHSVADGMCDAAVLFRYETVARPESLRWPTWSDDQWDRVVAGLDWFEARPPAGPLDLGAITLGCALGYIDFRYPDRGWRDGRSSLAAWYANAATRPSFADTVPVG